MASRVNTRFVAILLVILLLLAGGVTVAGVYALRKTGEQHAALAEKLMKEGDYEKAAEHWARAVNKNQGNAEWCARWADALEKTTPTPRQAYADRFITAYLMSLRGLSDAAPTDVAAQTRYLEMRFRHVQKTAAADLRAWESIVAVVDDVLGRFRENPEAGAPLRRYRGLAQVSLARIVGAGQRPKEEFQQAEADLKAAIAADPADEETVLGLATWSMLAAQQARVAGDAPGADRQAQRARTLLQDFVRQHPPASRSALATLQLDVGETIRQSPTAPRYDAVLAQRVDQLKGVAEAVKAEPKEKVDPGTVAVVCSYMTSVPDVGAGAARELMQSALERRPNDPYLLLVLGRAELTQGKTADALATLQKVYDLPDPPLSLDGLLLFGLRAEAVRWQVQAKLAEWDLAKAPADRAAALKGAQGYRDTLASYLGENEALVLLIDAKLDVARADTAGARTKLDQYNQLTNNNDTEAIIILADIMTREGNFGTAHDLYKKLLARDSNNTRILKLMADVESRQHDYKAAADRYRAVLATDPGDAEATEKLKTVADLAQGKDSDKAWVRALAQAQELASGIAPDYDAASAVVREAIAAGSDEPSLYVALARLRMLDDDMPGTSEALDQGLAKHPDDKRLKDFKRLLGSGGDPLVTLEEIVDKSEASDLNKKLLLFMAYQRAGKPDKAKDALAKAAEIDKNSPAVLEFQFQLALSQKDGAAARRIADAAAAVDSDHAQGKWFRARIEIAENRLEEGAAMLEQIASRDKLNVDVWRLLGNTRLTMGQAKPAAEAFNKVMEIRPSDIASIVGYLKAKGMLREYDTALAVAREKQALAGGDPEFVDVWLALETLAAGGDKNKALEVRQQLARRFPKNERNNMALASLLMEQKRWGEAKAVIDALMAEKADAQYVDLLARWHAAQGDGAAARDAVDRYVATLPKDKPSDGPYIVLAQTLVGFRQIDLALGAMDEARKRQDKKEMNADRSLGDMLFNMEQYDKAAQTYQRVLDAGSPDAGGKVVKRILECDLRLARYEDARRRLDSLGDAVETDTVLMMAKAEVLAATGKRAEARDLLDRAVAATKDEPTAYIRRADFLSRDLETLGDAEADLRQAMKLDPSSRTARQRLVALCVMSGRWSDAVGTLREGLAMDPENDDLRVMLVALHLDRKEVDEAVAVIEQVLRRRPDDLAWLGHAARVSASAGRWPQSVRYSERVWQLARTPDAAMLYIDAMLRTDPPDTAKAMAVLQAPELKVTENMPLLMTRARVYFRQAKPTEATQDALAALLLCKDDPSMIDSWFGAMEIIFPDPSQRLKAVLELKPPGGFNNWRAAFLAALKGTVPEAREEGMSELRQNAEANPQPDFRRFAYATLGSQAHSAKKEDEALEYWHKGLAIYPDDPELNNNIAYVLAAKMNRPKDALPYAERAAAVVPNNPAILDTLGAVYLALNDLPRAETVLMRAIGVAKGRDIPPILLRLGQLRAAQGNKKDAERYLRLLDDAITNDGVTKLEYENDAAELRRKISAM